MNRIAALFLCLLVSSMLSACRSTPPSPDSARFLAPPDANGRTPRDKVQIVYDERISPDRLTCDQVSAILDFAEPLAPPGRRVWLILVRANDAAANRCNAAVYFTPDMTSPRMRVGTVVTVEADGAADAPVSPSAGQTQPAVPRRYAMVSLPDSVFADSLCAPDEPTWPFFISGRLSNDDVVAFVDFARQALSEDLYRTARVDPEYIAEVRRMTDEFARQGASLSGDERREHEAAIAQHQRELDELDRKNVQALAWARQESLQPVWSVGVAARDVFTVTFGSIQGPLSGETTAVHVGREDGALVCLGIHGPRYY